MTSTNTTQQTEIQVLETEEVDSVAGGYIPSIDVSQMPDRSVMCGTMWLILQRGKIFTGTQH